MLIFQCCPAAAAAAAAICNCIVMFITWHMCLLARYCVPKLDQLLLLLLLLPLPLGDAGACRLQPHTIMQHLLSWPLLLLLLQ
jgi:hypothetical protein